jgi:hypothetical protein
MKHQPPSSNLQRSTKHQAPSGGMSASFDVWNLKLLWSLELGIWRFET